MKSLHYESRFMVALQVPVLQYWISTNSFLLPGALQCLMSITAAVQDMAENSGMLSRKSQCMTFLAINKASLLIILSNKCSGTSYN